MPGCGGFNPLPMRLGGGKARAKIILDSLAAGRGTAYAASNPNTAVYVETLAVARAIARAWGTNQRLANVRDPRRTCLLERWEAIYGFRVAPGEKERERRERIAEIIAGTGRPSLLTLLNEILTRALGPVFVGVDFISPNNAVVHAPDASYPWGQVTPGIPWSSTVAHILIHVTQPPGYTMAHFYEVVGRVDEVMGPISPAWTTWDWYMCPEIGSAIAVPGGPRCAGWYLDERNIDHSVFDE